MALSDMERKIIREAVEKYRFKQVAEQSAQNQAASPIVSTPTLSTANAKRLQVSTSPTEQVKRQQESAQILSSIVNPSPFTKTQLADLQAKKAEAEYEAVKGKSAGSTEASTPYAARGTQTTGSGSYAAGLQAKEAPAANDEEAAAKAKAEYYRQQANAAQEQETMQRDMEELQSWPEADRAALEKYVAQSSAEWYDQINPATDNWGKAGDAYTEASALFSKYGAQKVKELAESYSRYKNSQTAQEVTQAAQEGAGGVLGAVGHSAATVGANVLGAISSPLGYLKEATTQTGRYSTMDPNNEGNIFNTYSGAVRSEVAENIAGGNGNAVRKGLSYGYQGVMSAADSLARALLGGGNKAVSLGLAATGSFGQTMSEASSQGASPAQAAALATANAFLEVGTEYLPLDNLLNTAKKGAQGAKAAIKEALKQGGMEIIEEEASFLGSLAAEAAILREKSSYNQQIGEMIANGMSYKEAKQQAAAALWKEALDTAVISGLSGGVSSLGATTAGTVQQVVEDIREDPDTIHTDNPLYNAIWKVTRQLLRAKGELKDTPAQTSTQQTDTQKQSTEGGQALNTPAEAQTTAQATEKTITAANDKNEHAYLEKAVREWIEQGNSPISPKVPQGGNSAGIEHVLYNEDGTPFEAMGAASLNNSGLAAYDQLLYDGNVQHARSTDAKHEEVPVEDGYGRRVSEFAANAINSEVISERDVTALKQLIAAGAFGHETQNMESVAAAAAERIQKRGMAGSAHAITRDVANGHVTEHTIAEAQLLFAHYSNNSSTKAQDMASELLIDLEQMATQSGRQLNMFKLLRRLTPEGQFLTWQKTADKFAAEASQKTHKPIQINLSDDVKRDFLSVSDARETAVTDAAETLNQAAMADASEAAKKVVRSLKPSPYEVGDRAGSSAAKSVNATRSPNTDDLYNALMTFIRTKKNRVAPTSQRNAALSALQQFYENHADFEEAWHQARRRVESDLAGDTKGTQILLEFLDTGGMAQDVMDAQDNRSVSRKAVREAARATDTKLSTLVASSLQDKDAALEKIQGYIAENYSLTGESAQQMAAQIQEAFYWELSDRQTRRLRAMFAEKGSASASNGTLLTKFRELYNLGAFDRSGLISREALKRVFGVDGLVLSDAVLDEYGKVSEARRGAVENRIIQEIANRLPTSAWNAANKWRYTAMLANPSTHLKNLTGTMGQFVMQHGIKDQIAAGIEQAAYFVSGGKTTRTKAALNPLNKQDQQLVVAAWEDYKNEQVAESIKNGGQYGNARSKVQDATRAWKLNDPKGTTGRAVNKVLGAAESIADLNSKALDVEDAAFGRTSYALALAGYMKANGLASITPEAQAYAIKQAQEATFHDESFLYSKVKGWSSSKLFNMAVPFWKTNVNTAARTVEYSPAGLIKSGLDLLRTAAGKGDTTTADFANEFSKGLVGSALWGIGAWLAKEGLLRITGVGEEEREYQERMGYKDWTALIDGEYKDIRFLSPMCVPLMTGAAIYEAAANWDDGATWQDVVNAIYSISDPIISSSPASNLDSFMYAIRSMESATTGEMTATILREIVESYTSQFIPALLRRVVTAEDNTARQYVSDPDNPFADFTQNITASLPGGRDEMYAKYDPWGQTLKQDATGDGSWKGTLARTLNISSTADVHTTEIDEEITRLLNLGYSAAMPTEGQKTISVPGIDNEGNSTSTKVQMSQSQWDAYKQTRGEASFELAKQIISSSAYAAMDDSEKTALLFAAYSYANELGKEAALPGQYTRSVGSYLDGLDGYGADVAAALINHAVSDGMTDAIGGMVTLWENGRDVSGAVDALESAAKVFDALSGDEQAAIQNEATGRLKAFLQARKANISAAAFADAYTMYYSIGKKYDDVGTSGFWWSYALQSAVEKGKFTSAQASVLKDSLKFWQQIPAETTKFDEMTAAGLSAATARTITEKVENLKPQSGYSTVRDSQKAETVLSIPGLSESQKAVVMKMYLNDAQDENLDEVRDMGMTVADYMTAWKIYDSESGTGKKQRTIEKYQKQFGVTYEVAKVLYEIYNGGGT